jgi:hypothetical protein
MLCRGVLTLVTGLYTLSHCASAVQYCHNNPSEPNQFCVALSIFHNETTQSDDYYFSLATRFVDNKGWLAIGSGFEMHRALMFVMYPGVQEDGSIPLDLFSLQLTNFN